MCLYADLLLKTYFFSIFSKKSISFAHQCVDDFILLMTIKELVKCGVVI